MTCASCAARVEKKLNRMEGVTATVNFATEKAKISYPPGVEVADLIATVVRLPLIHILRAHETTL
ncbi:heavy-metal-associated domain-containing protein, partial [Streptomyces sp. XM83C]|nr:heavy-metal-associated domain-containing protein [Streptomyces sp. XM83C]